MGTFYAFHVVKEVVFPNYALKWAIQAFHIIMIQLHQRHRESRVKAHSRKKKFEKDKKFNEQLALVTGYIKYTDEHWDELEKPDH